MREEPTDYIDLLKRVAILTVMVLSSALAQKQLTKPTSSSWP
jgi:hypothetical protein